MIGRLRFVALPLHPLLQNSFSWSFATTYLVIKSERGIAVPLSIAKIALFSESRAQFAIFGISDAVQLELSSKLCFWERSHQLQTIFRQIVVSAQPQLFVLLQTYGIEHFLQEIVRHVYRQQQLTVYFCILFSWHKDDISDFLMNFSHVSE